MSHAVRQALTTWETIGPMAPKQGTSIIIHTMSGPPTPDCFIDNTTSCSSRYRWPKAPPPPPPTARIGRAVENWCVVRDPLAMRFAKTKGGVQLHARTSFSYLGNGWTDCAEIWYVVRDQLTKRLTEVEGGVQVHVRTCSSLFSISVTAGRTALKFGVWLGDHYLSVLHRMGDICTGARATVTHFKHVYSFPLVRDPEGGLLVTVILPFKIPV